MIQWEQTRPLTRDDGFMRTERAETSAQKYHERYGTRAAEESCSLHMHRSIDYRIWYDGV